MRITALLIGLVLLVAPLNAAHAARNAARKTSKTKTTTPRKTEAKPSLNAGLNAGYAALAKNDFRGAIDAWRPLFKNARGEMIARALWPQFAQLCLENDRLSDLESAARNADSLQSSPELRAAARLVLRRAAWREKSLTKAKNFDEKLNFIRDWQVIGPFENEENDIHKKFAPETQDTLGKVLKGQNDRPVRWRKLPIAREEIAFVGRFLGDFKSDEASVFYAQTAINMPSARLVQLRFNHSGAAKIWLNGKLIFADEKQRTAQNFDPDVFVITQKLEAGWNSLLLKISDETPSQTCFSLRLTTEKGADLSEILSGIKSDIKTDATRFQWQSLSGQMENARLDLIQNLTKNFSASKSNEEEKTLVFAKRFLSESDEASPVVLLLAPPQISLRQKAAKLKAESKIKEAVAAYQELLNDEEFQPEILENLARLQILNNDSTSALDTLKKLRAFRPQDGEIAAEYAELLEARGEKAGASAVYQQAITLDTSQTVWRERARVLTGEKSLLDMVSDVKWISDSQQKTDAVLLLDEARQIVYDDRATLTRFHQIIQINNANAARRYANFSVENPSRASRLTIESAVVISAGKRREVVLNNSQNTLKIPALMAGDILDFTYRIEENQRGLLERQFWTQWFFNLADMPVQTSRFVLITPLQVAFNISSHGDVAAPERSQIKSGNATWDVREWRMENLAARPLEALSPAPQDANLWIDISSVVTWKSIADWYNDLCAARLVPNAAVRAKALEITQNARSDSRTSDSRTDEEKLRALYFYVARDLREQKISFSSPEILPQSVSKTMRDGYGTASDKAALLVALCDAASIKARLALFNERRDGLTPYLPSPRFKRVMVVAQIAGEEMWLDVSNGDFDNLPAENQGVPALLIENGATTQSATTQSAITLTDTPIAVPESNIVATKYQATLDDAGNLKGEAETAFSGEWGTALRARWQAAPTASRAAFVREITRLAVPALQLSPDISHNFAKPDETLKIDFAFANEKYAMPENDTFSFALPWPELASISKPILKGAAQERAQGCEVAALRGLGLDTLKLKLPLGFRPQELPEEIKDNSAFGRYRFTYKIEDDKNGGTMLIVSREVLLSPLRVSVEDAPSYIAFCKAIANESARKIILKK